VTSFEVWALLAWHIAWQRMPVDRLIFVGAFAREAFEKASAGDASPRWFS
jgi:hypothetical protein